MKVLLIQLPHEGREPAFFARGLGYTVRVLVRSQVEMEVLDIWAHGYSRDQLDYFR